MDKKKKNVAIIGAGISGLVTAYHLHKQGISFQLFEKSDHIGGVIHSKQKNGFLYETGPNSGVIGNAEVANLFEELKNHCKLEIADKDAARRLIWKKGRWYALPSGIGGGITTPLFTWKDKFGILGEPFRKKGDNPNESLAHLVKRRMGKSFLDYAIDPFILGIYAGDPEYIVPKYALPKLYNLEQNYGSFIGGAIKKRKEPKTEDDKKATREIFSVEGGLERLVDALVMTIGRENIHTNCHNLQINKSDEKFVVTNGDTKTTFTHVVSTSNSSTLESLFPFIDKNDLKPIASLAYAKVTEVSIGFKKWEGIPLNAFGGLIPFKEDLDILGVLFMSTLFKNRAPEGGALLTTFVGGIRKAALADLPEEKLKALVGQQIQKTMELKTFQPDLFEIAPHTKAIAQYGADSGDRLAAISRIQKTHSGLYLAGSIRDGIGLADRIKQGRMLADEISNN
jgi:oxygen-dependent protoporphyrinogen oxidase